MTFILISIEENSWKKIYQILDYCDQQNYNKSIPLYNRQGIPNMFVIDFDSDSSQENEVNSNIKDSTTKIDQIVTQTQSFVINSQTKQKDKYISNQISKNILNNQDDEDFIHQDGPQENEMINSIFESQMKSTTQNKSPRRKKVDTQIKLEPLKNLQIAQKSQIISLIKTPSLMKTQSQPYHSQSNKFQSQSLSISQDNVQKIQNSELGLSSKGLNNKQISGNSRTKKKNDEKCSNKLKLELSENVFFQGSDEQDNSNDKNINQNAPKKQVLQKIYAEQSEQRFDDALKQDENEKREQSKGEEVKIEVKNQPNPEISKENISNLQDYLSKINGSNLKENSQFENIKNLLFQSITTNSVLNLRLIRNQSFLNFLSPEFRIEYHSDHYFIMNSKKISSKPTSTFTFTGSLSTFDESSKKYLGKMKSNIVGDSYNIFGPGLNPSKAKDKNVPPRQLLATILFRTQVFGTGKPKEFTVFVKKPQCHYYRDLRGVKMYDDEVPLHQLYYRYLQNRQNIQVFHSRKPIFHQQKKEYLMNFQGKVKKPSIKNFILQDRQNQNKKVLLFGKVTDESFALDVYNPITPIVGIGIALTMFDSRIGGD